MTFNPHWKRDMFIGLIGIAILAVLLGWGYLEEKKHAYNCGYDAGYSKALSPWLQAEQEIQWHSTEMFIIEDNEVDEYVLDLGWHPPLVWPIYHVCKRSVLPDTTDWKEWFDTSRGWDGLEITEKLARTWYDGVDSTHSAYENAALAWALSYLLREQTFVIYFDSTDTITSLYNCSGYVYSGRDKKDNYPLHRIVEPCIRSWLIYGPQYNLPDIHPEAEWPPEIDWDTIPFNEPLDARVVDSLFPMGIPLSCPSAEATVWRESPHVLTFVFTAEDVGRSEELYGPPYPWFWSDSVVANDEHWLCPDDTKWHFLPSCVLRDSFPDVCVLRFPELIGLWDDNIIP